MANIPSRISRVEFAMGRAKRNYVNMALMHAIRPSCVYNLISGHARGPTLDACVCVCVIDCVCV